MEKKEPIAVFEISIDPKLGRQVEWNNAAISAAKEIGDTKAFVEVRANNRIALNDISKMYIAHSILEDNDAYGWTVGYYPDYSLTLRLFKGEDYIADEKKHLGMINAEYTINGEKETTEMMA